MSKALSFKLVWVLFFCGLLCTSCTTISLPSRSHASDDLAVLVTDAIEVAASISPHNVIVVFDIDNTLMAMEQGLGADQWYEWQSDLWEKDPCHEHTVANRLAVQGALYFASAMRPTQTDAPDLVRQTQDAGIPVIAITSRGVGFRLQTFRELRRNGFDFRRNAIGPEGGWPENFIPDGAKRPTRYEDGVYLTSGQHKGAMLQNLLQRTNTPLPTVIFMADDNQDNLDAVTETFTGLGVSVRSWRYTGEDDNVAAFNAELSHHMWQELLPAMETIQKLFGPDNYELPENNRLAECLSSDIGTVN